MKLSPGPLLQSLIKTILVPLLCGAAARAAIPGEQGERERHSVGHRAGCGLLQNAASLCLLASLSALSSAGVGRPHLLDALVICD